MVLTESEKPMVFTGLRVKRGSMKSAVAAHLLVKHAKEVDKSSFPIKCDILAVGSNANLSYHLEQSLIHDRKPSINRWYSSIV